MASPALQREPFSLIMLEKPQAGILSRLHYNTANQPCQRFFGIFNLSQEELLFSLQISFDLLKSHTSISFFVRKECTSHAEDPQSPPPVRGGLPDDCPGERVGGGGVRGKDSLLLLAGLALLARFYPGGFSVEAFTVDMGIPGMDLSPRGGLVPAGGHPLPPDPPPRCTT